MNAMDTGEDNDRVRVDKWLWAARFFKTRSLAAAAATGGNVSVNGTHAKPSRMIRSGDRIELRWGEDEFTLTVKGIARQRRPAPEAQLLYEETQASRETRERISGRIKSEVAPEFTIRGRPSKKNRRALLRFIKKRW